MLTLLLLFFSLLQVISLEGWTDIMYYVQDAHSFWDWIYFVLLIVVSAGKAKQTDRRKEGIKINTEKNIEEL